MFSSAVSPAKFSCPAASTCQLGGNRYFAPCVKTQACRSAVSTRLVIKAALGWNQAQVEQRQKASLVRRSAEIVAIASVVAAVFSISPSLAGEAASHEQLVAAESSPQLPDRPKMKGPRPTLKSVKPEDSTADTRLGRASEAATHEMRIRAAMFDDAVTRTNDVKDRTQGFVKSMWQSLE